EILAATPLLMSHSVAATPTHRRDFKRDADRSSIKRDTRRESGKRIDQSTTSPFRESNKRDPRYSEPNRQVVSKLRKPIRLALNEVDRRYQASHWKPLDASHPEPWIVEVPTK
ncbi:jg27680, partial [Pararge aegeria aegeria]